MARAQQTAGNLTIWLIVFVFFWLVSTVWLVILYTGQEDLRNENERLTRHISRLATPQEESSIPLIQSLSERGPTAAGLLEQARGETALLASGSEHDGVNVIRTKRNELLSRIRDEGLIPKPGAFQDVSLLDAAGRLYDEFRREHELRRTVEDRVAQLDAEVNRLIQTAGEEKAALDRRADEIKTQLAQVEAAREEFRRQQGEALAVMEREFDNRRRQTDEDLTRERQLRAAAEEQLARMRVRLEGLRSRCAGVLMGPRELAPARVPDGRVLTAFPGDEIVYINLGARDHLQLGLQFAVYSEREGIGEDGVSKGTIEVVAIWESTSECRIVALANGAVVLEGDLIANPVYDRDRAPVFVVIGSFDLNYDGERDPDGAGVIEAMIAQWGGTVAREIGATTDFVIAGMAPPKPREVSDPSEEERRRMAMMRAAWEEYTGAMETARTLSIPVMSQQVFLNFMGQGTRTLRR